jgi:hypothetical protein
LFWLVVSGTLSGSSSLTQTFGPSFGVHRCLRISLGVSCFFRVVSMSIGVGFCSVGAFGGVKVVECIGHEVGFVWEKTSPTVFGVRLVLGPLWTRSLAVRFLSAWTAALYHASALSSAGRTIGMLAMTSWISLSRPQQNLMTIASPWVYPACLTSSLNSSTYSSTERFPW